MLRATTVPSLALLRIITAMSEGKHLAFHIFHSTCCPRSVEINKLITVNQDLSNSQFDYSELGSIDYGKTGLQYSLTARLLDIRIQPMPFTNKKLTDKRIGRSPENPAQHGLVRFRRPVWSSY